MRTSITHPLEIAEVQPGPDCGLIGITFCPGKVQSFGLTGSWHRDLALDLDGIEDWNAAVVVTLVEERELTLLEVPGLGEAVIAHHIEWLHLPIADRGTPDAAFEERWKEVGESLRARLRDGANVLVHCMGGLGRAGLVASRLLIELGWSASDAVAAVRKVRPGAIETDEQMDFVHGCVSVAEHLPALNDTAIRDRALGALVGLAVGDAVGTTLEFKVRDSYPRLTDMVGGGPFALEAGQWTDDTAMALALADSLIACGKLDETDLMQRFLSWYQDGAYSCTGTCFDIGITTRQALMRFDRDGDPIAGDTDPMSAGNGSVMRLAPIALRYFDDGANLVDAAARQSRTTHAAPEAVEGCIAFARVLAEAISGHLRSHVLRPRDTEYAGQIADVLAGSWRSKARADISSSGYVIHSLEAAFWCVSRTANFRDAILLAANLGDDADTVAAITGQLAGALYGASNIPDDWLAKLAMQGRIYGMGQELLKR
jgi:ADP-ribosyl-[dinitrogen reductase] hydrolase